MAQCDVQSLMTEAKCFTCLSPGMWQALELALLCDLIEKINNIGTVTKEIFSGNGDPNGVITPQVTDAIYRQLDSLPVGMIWTWQGAGPWIAPDF